MNASRILTQNVQGLPEDDDTKLKLVIKQMKNENWDAACLQETWRLRTDDLYINNYHIFFQGNSTKINTRGQVMGGVCIILSSTFYQVHKKNRREVIKLETGENFEGRIIGVPLTFPNIDNNRKNIKGELDITLCSIYHPVDNIEFKNFNTILSLILTQLPPETNIILGHDINANVGTSANNGQHPRERIGACGIENRNKKGTSLINLMASLNMKITNSFFNPRPLNLDATTTHTTWRNPNASKSQHMPDVFSCLNTFFNRVQGCNPTKKVQKVITRQ
jgi:hypothetical protein